MKSAPSSTTLAQLCVAGGVACFVMACGSAGWRGESVFEGTTPAEAYHQSDDAESGDDQPTTMPGDQPTTMPDDQPTTMPDETDPNTASSDTESSSTDALLHPLPEGTEFAVGFLSTGGLTGHGVGTLLVDSVSQTATFETLSGEACTTPLSAEDVASLFDAAAALHNVQPDEAYPVHGTCADCVLHQLAWDVTVAEDSFSGNASGTDVSPPMIPAVLPLWQQMSALRTRVANDPICGA